MSGNGKDKDKDDLSQIDLTKFMKGFGSDVYPESEGGCSVTLHLDISGSSMFGKQFDDIELIVMIYTEEDFTKEELKSFAPDLLKLCSHLLTKEE